jgi:NAD+ synthase
MLSDPIVEWLRGQAAAAGAGGFVVGLSGGLDSACVVRLCQIALPGQVIGVLLPCHSDPADERDARLVADHFAIATTRIDLGPAYDALLREGQAALAAATLGSPVHVDPDAALDDIRARVPSANIKPRLRMSMLYFLANSLHYLVAGTGNRSEIMLGYYTKYGDGGVDLLPIGHLLKGEVRALAKELGIPQPIVDKPPSAGLWHGQTDEAEMGFTYADLERYLEEGPETVSPALAMRIERLVRASGHKREMPPYPIPIES